MLSNTIRLTTAQAIVRFLCNQYIKINNERRKLFGGVFAIFGHGNVTCLGEALHAAQDELPTWRGQNEQSMTLAAVAYAKAMRRQQIMIATSSIGPGAMNMVNAAAVAHANRLPVMLLGGDTFANRRPDPVLQQIEHFDDPSVTANDAFKPVCRYWDRITHPEQIISSLPQAIAIMLDPSDCGPVFLGLCQDTQELAFEYPLRFFEPRIHQIPRPRADKNSLERAVFALKSAKRPLIISGGGVRYSGAEIELGNFAEKRGVPLCETIAGKGSVHHYHPAHVGPIGVIGSSSANTMAYEADVILAIGTRLQDFTTGSWTAFAEDAQFISINAARFDATKHSSIAVVGDALVSIQEIDNALQSWRIDSGWTKKGADLFKEWNELLDKYQKPTIKGLPTYAQVVRVVNDEAATKDLVLTAAGGLPGELTKGWKIKSPHTFDCEFGFSCMGYEISGGLGAAMADSTRDVFVMVGDGSYLMLNSELYSSVITGHKMIIIVCDNKGYAVIDRLQNFKGSVSFNNLLKDCRTQVECSVDFVKHAESMGALGRRVGNIAELVDAVRWSKETDRTTLISIETEPNSWVPGDAAWDVGVPEVSERKEVRQARDEQEKIRKSQRIGI